MVEIEHALIDCPAYEGGRDVYYADSCEPLVDAVARDELTMAAMARNQYPATSVLDESCLPGIQTVGYWDAPSQQDWGLDWHRNEGIELTYLARGSLGFSVDAESWTLHPGFLTITRPWQRHKLGTPNVSPSRLHWCIVDVGVRRPNQTWRWPDWINLAHGDLVRLTKLLQLNEQPVWTANEDIHAAFETIARIVHHTGQRTTESKLRVLISGLFVSLLELLDSKTVKLDPNLTTARRAVEHFLTELDYRLGERWTLEEMARQCGLRRSRFSQYCQEITNMSPMEYLKYRRLNLACALLKRPGISVTEIAFECGFQSSQYFATVFARRFGVSPSQYR